MQLLVTKQSLIVGEQLIGHICTYGEESREQRCEIIDKIEDVIHTLS